MEGGNIWVVAEPSRLWHSTLVPVRLTTGPVVMEYPVPSKDGKRLFVMGKQSQLQVEKLDSGVRNHCGREPQESLTSSALFRALQKPSACQGCSLLGKNQQGERLPNHLWPGMRILRCGGRWRSEVGGHGIYIVVLGVESHGSRAALRRDRLDHGVFIGRVLMRDRDCAVSAGGEHQSSRGIEAIRVYTLADRPRPGQRRWRPCGFARIQSADLFLKPAPIADDSATKVAVAKSPLHQLRSPATAPEGS